MNESVSPRVPLKILLVEDQPLDAELLIAALENAGYSLAPFERVDTPEEFIRQLESQPDVILCDYQLPRFGALEALRLLNASKHRVPFIIVSGTIGEETAVEAIKNGAADYLLKDRLGRLGPAVAHAIEEAKLRGAAERAEENLRESEFKYRCVFEHLLDAAYLCDAVSGRIIDTNARGEAILGLERAAILGAPLARFIPPSAWVALQGFVASQANSLSDLPTEITGRDARRAVRLSATIVAIRHRRLLLTFLREVGSVSSAGKIEYAAGKV
jgi:PAS domain S-box-containing protein